MTLTALVTGVTGQDGVFLARHLAAEGYRVVGTRQPGTASPLTAYLEGVHVTDHDLRDHAGFDQLLADHHPDEVYNLAGFTAVGASWDYAGLVEEVNAIAVEAMLASLVRHGSDVRFFQASSSEVFGPEAVNPQDETTSHAPQNPYGESKSRAHRATVRCRDEHGLHASVGILYNHESPLRGVSFVTRKITRAAAEIAAGRRTSVTLGNLDISRDWGSARDYVAAMHAMVRHEEAGEFVVATGQLHTLEQLLVSAFAAAGLEDAWSYVEQDAALLRPTDAPGLTGNPSRAAAELGWTASTTFDQLVEEMVRVDGERVATGVEESVDYLAP